MTIVLGGGLSGLSAAYYVLKKFGEKSTVFESSKRVGGWIRSERYKEQGIIFETAARTIRPKGPAGANTLKLIEDLQLPIDAIPSTHDAARNRMIFAKGKLCMLPNSLGGIFRTNAPFSRPLASALLYDLFGKTEKAKYGDETIYNFAKRRFGSEIAEYAISPMICGICAGDAKEISVRFLMNDIFEQEQKWGGVVKGILLSKMFQNDKEISDNVSNEPLSTLYEKACREKWSMYRIQGGLEWLPRSLSNYLKLQDVNIQLSSECRELLFSKDGVRMHIRGREHFAHHVISALPSYKLANCVKNEHPSLAVQLLTIPYVDVAVVNLQYNSKNLIKNNAFGFLVPPIEKLPILGVIFDSCCFDMHGNTVLTVMMGGKWFQEYFGENPSQKDLLDVALSCVNKILNINEEPRMSRVHILPKCIPQYTLGHKNRVEAIRRYIAQYELPLSLCGAAYDGVGINDVILSARKQVDMLTQVLE